MARQSRYCWVKPQLHSCDGKSFVAIWRLVPKTAAFLALIAWAGVAFSQVTATGKRATAVQTVEKKPQWAELRKVVEKYFAELRGRQDNDILVANEARATLGLLEKAGWKPKETEKLLSRVPGDGDFLVRELRSKEGRKFLSATGSQSLVYDRLDRLSAYSGGDRLVSSIIRLPNGPSFMRPKPTPGFGTLMDLLPKGANGKTPVDPKFNQPTGKIYTSAQWIKELEAAHVAESKPSPPHKSSGR